ncbi:MAG: hypothetical protein AAFN74_02880, partial [Myxococcota bacterium]
AAGQLSDRDLQALHEAASNDPALQRAIELCTPVDDAFNARLAARMQSSLHNAPPSSPTSSPSPRARRRWRPAFRRSAPWAVAVAAAAVLALWLVRTPELYLPPFSLEVSLARDAYRAPAAREATLRVARGEAVELLARPALRVSVPVRAWVFIEHDAALMAVDVQSKTDPSGSIKMTATAGDWPSGLSRLVVAVGTTSASPSHHAVAARDDRWQWSSVAIDVK